ncbi:MAG: hypothetical protein DMG48_05160 [Acidobacteria bacterium]|nr:MAG: hypothetical protein DMG48_05160 [Acidobacteriota bacterium]
MAATAQIIIEVDDKGATNAFKQINAEAGKLGPTLQPVQRISEQTFNNIESGALRARESAALLGEEFGVKIPRALRGTIAQAAGIGSIFSAAFSGLAVLGFIEIAKVAGEKIAGVAAEMLGWGEATKKAMEAQGELNKVFIEANDHIDKLRESYRLIGLSGLPLISEKQAIANENFDAAKKKVADLTAELAKLQKQSKETHEVLLSNPATGMVGGSVTESTEAARKASAKIEGAGSSHGAGAGHEECWEGIRHDVRERPRRRDQENSAGHGGSQREARRDGQRRKERRSDRNSADRRGRPSPNSCG